MTGSDDRPGVLGKKMTVHMFRVYIGKGKMDISDLEARVSEWLDQNARWTEDNTSHELTGSNTEIDGSGEVYYDIDVRFLQEDSKANLQTKFTDKIKNKVSWYRVGYHACQHDQTDGEECDWDDKEDWPTSGDIPNYVPDINVTNG